MVVIELTTPSVLLRTAEIERCVLCCMQKSLFDGYTVLLFAVIHIYLTTNIYQIFNACFN